MPNFAIITPKTRTIRNFEAKDYFAAVEAAGLTVGKLDFGSVAQWHDGSSLSILVYEFSLLDSTYPNQYFVLENQLYNGPAVLYKSDSEGETTDLPTGLAEHLSSEECTHFRWLGTIENVEKAIADKIVRRPQSAVNGTVVWKWNKRAEERS